MVENLVASPDGNLEFTQLSMAEALAEQERALAAHALHADEAWQDRAESIVRSLPAGRRFLAEEVSQALRVQGFSTHDNRAMGLVIRRLARKGVIVSVGASPAKSSHGSLKPLWERQVEKT